MIHRLMCCPFQTLELLEKVTKNSAVQPAEEKYRKLKLRCVFYRDGQAAVGDGWVGSPSSEWRVGVFVCEPSAELLAQSSAMLSIGWPAC